MICESKQGLGSQICLNHSISGTQGPRDADMDLGDSCDGGELDPVAVGSLVARSVRRSSSNRCLESLSTTTITIPMPWSDTTRCTTHQIGSGASTTSRAENSA